MDCQAKDGSSGIESGLERGKGNSWQVPGMMSTELSRMSTILKSNNDNFKKP